jgi:phosphoserine phosphatase RsbU/P
MAYRAEIVSDLLQRTNISAPDMLIADVAAALVAAGGNHLVVWVVDYEQETLRSVGLAAELVNEPPEVVPLLGTMAGRAFRAQTVLSAETDNGWRVWAPLRERAEELGVVEFGFQEMSDETLALCEDLGRLVGHIVRTAGRYTDLVELRRRRRPMSMAAELQWDLLLPPLVFRSPDVAVAGALEPAYEVGGDGFDYSLNHDRLDFVFLDAMGHSLRSSLASAMVLAAARHSRRRGLDLAETARVIDVTLSGEFDGDIFVTGHIGQLNVADGRLRWVNAGHPHPLLARGVKVLDNLRARPCLPFGLGTDGAEVGEHRLEPGDRVLFYSDGVVEARPAGGEEFGQDHLVERLERYLSDRLLAGELLRRIAADVIAHRNAPLQDDASLMLIDWRLPVGRS